MGRSSPVLLLSFLLLIIGLFKVSILSCEGCYGNAGSTSPCPNTCPTGYTSAPGASGFCTCTPSGYYTVDNVNILTCAAGQYSGSCSSDCTDIQPGCYGISPTGNSCPNNCPAGQYSLGGASACSSVSPGTVLSQSKIVIDFIESSSR